MAREPGEEEAEAPEPEEKPSGGGMKWILIILIVVVVLVAGGAAAWIFLGGGGSSKKAGDAKAGGQKAESADAVGKTVPLQTFIVNLADPGGRRYLKATIELELTGDEGANDLKSRLPQVRDQIIMALSSKTFQQIQGVAGKTVLREELTARVNTIIKKGKVKNTYFTEFVVQ